MLFLAVHSGLSVAYSADVTCRVESVKAPPIFVVPTGYDELSDNDAVDRKRESKVANYYRGEATNSKGQKVGKPLIVPKRSIVQVRDDYREVIEQNGTYAKSRNDMWVPVRVLSVPPENTKIQEARGRVEVRNVGREQNSRGSIIADPNDPESNTGFLKVADLEQVSKQDTYVFVVKQDSELFTKLNDKLAADRLVALQPLALILKKNADDEYEVNQCCVAGTRRCTDYPIFQVINVRDRNGKPYEVSHAFEYLKCADMDALVPIDESALKPIRSLLSHPSLGLPGASNIPRVASITHLNFVDSRGFVQIPMTGDEPKRTGPFNSLHYGPESGDADVYLKPDVACGFVQFLKTWNQTCKGRDECLIEFGDASHALYKSKVGSGDSAPWPHYDHSDGQCIDINTSRMAKDQLEPMMQTLMKFGTGECFTTETRISKTGGCSLDYKKIPGTEKLIHGTHMHVCFPSNTSAYGRSKIPNPKLKEACERGVK